MSNYKGTDEGTIPRTAERRKVQTQTQMQMQNTTSTPLCSQEPRFVYKTLHSPGYCRLFCYDGDDEWSGPRTG